MNDADVGVASTEVGKVFSFADNDTNNANGINHRQIVKKASTYRTAFKITFIYYILKTTHISEIYPSL